MGMFDYVNCKYTLPQSEVQNHLFQTKDFDCELDVYTITDEGRLIHHVTKSESVPEEERPFYGTPKWNEDEFYQLCGCIKQVPVADVDMNFHGDFDFYGSVGNSSDYIWYEYQVRFTEGQLQWIKRVEDSDITASPTPVG